MICNIYAIRDVKAGFLSPTFESADAIAIRNFSHAVINSSDVLKTFAGDFSLYRLGTYDTDSGVIAPEHLPVHIFDASEAFALYEKKR